jgi:hypothetical protein
MKLSDLKDIAAIVQSISTAIAIFAGGIWTYRLFIYKREKHPRAKIEHQIVYKILVEEKSLLCLDINVSNVGGVLLLLVPRSIQIRQILPLSTNWFKDDEQNTRWMLIANKEDLDERIEIEPGESYSLHYEFIIKSDVKTVSISSFFSDSTKSQRNHIRIPKASVSQSISKTRSQHKSFHATPLSSTVKDFIDKTKIRLNSVRQSNYLRREAKRKSALGWNLITIHDLNSP